MTTLRLRSPIFDHSILGIPIRRQLRRGSVPKEDIETAEFKFLSSALKEATLDPIMWKNAAKANMNWTVSEAELHLELFESMWKVEELQAIPDVVEDPETAKCLRFALFILIQLYELHRPRRTSSIDNFNTHAVSPTEKARADNVIPDELQDLETDPRQLILESRATEWTHRLSFVKRRMADILTVLVEVSGSADKKVSRKVIDSLGFLIAATDSFGNRATRLSIQLLDLENQTIEFVAQSLNKCLVADEVRNPQWSSLDSTKGLSIASSILQGAPTMVRGAGSNELVVIPPPLVHTNSNFKTATIVVANHGACIISLTPSTYAHIIGCSDCTIFLGAVYGVCTIEHCERIKFVGACGRLRLVNCIDTKVNVWTGTRPILLGDCRGIVCGPLSARYLTVKIQAESVCPADQVLSEKNQAWRQPVIADVGGVEEEDLEPSVFSIQSVDDFTFEPVFAAFQQDHPAEDIVTAQLPTEYEKKILEKKETVQACLNMVQEAVNWSKSNRSSPSKAEIQSHIQVAFKEWLVSSGNIETISLAVSKLSTSSINE